MSALACDRQIQVDVVGVHEVLGRQKPLSASFRWIAVVLAISGCFAGQVVTCVLR